MKTKITTNTWYQSNRRLAGLRRFALSITAFNIVGHTLLGFEQAWAHPLVALATGYSIAILLEMVYSWSVNKTPRFMGQGILGIIDFLLPVHIASLAISMLIYTNNRLTPLMFAVAVALGSKVLLRLPIANRSQHIFNPSNFGIVVTLLLFPSVSVSPPYHYTENIVGIGNFIFPVVLMIFGSFLNYRYTKRMPLIIAWFIGFSLQAIVRAVLFNTPLIAGLMPITGVTFLLFTFYMVTDPATTPNKTSSQIIFGLSVALVYGILTALHIVFALFFALPIVCFLRSLGMYTPATLNLNQTPIQPKQAIA